MKKNMFLLLSIYLFVVQPLLAGFLRSDNEFLIMAGVNLVVIALLAFIYLGSTSSEDKEENKPKKKTSKVGKKLLLWLILAALIVFLIVQRGRLQSAWSRIGEGVTNLGTGIEKNISNDQDMEDDLDDNNLVGNGEVLAVVTGEDDIVEMNEDSPNIISEDVLGDTEIGVKDEISDKSKQEILLDTIEDEPIILSNERVVMIDAIKYLLKSNNVIISSEKNIKFSYISYSNSNYKYFKTARDMKLIGSNSNPSIKISCDTYQVMKGLVQGREVGSYSNIKTAYRNKSSELGMLNGCERGSLLLEKNL